MSLKRTSDEIGNQSKKPCVSENYLHKCLEESGLTLKHPPEKCLASQETIQIIRNLQKNLDRHYHYPRNLEELFSDFEDECKDEKVLQHYLFPNVIKICDDNVEGQLLSHSVVKILLSVPSLQKKMVNYVFNKAIDLAAAEKCAPWIQKILKCFSSLDHIVDSEKMSSSLITLLDIATDKTVKLEIITAIPDIVGDQEHDNIVAELSRILREDCDLIPAILDCFSYLCLSDTQHDQIQQKALNIVKSLPKCIYYPNFVKFLLLSGRTSETACADIVQGLRDSLGWPSSLASPQEIATSQVLTASAMRNSIVASKTISNAWLKVVSNCKIETDHKPIDFIILLVIYSTSEEKQRQVETLIKKQIKLNILKESLLDEVFENYKPILKDQFKSLIALTNALMRIVSEPLVVSFASHIYLLMFSELRDRQTIIAELLHLGLCSKECLMNTLVILNNVAAKDMSLLKPQSLQMLTLLDQTDRMTLSEIKAVVNIVCGLAYSYENSVIRDDMHMIIRKQLGTSRPKVKIHGILSGVHAIKYLTAKNDDEESIELPDDVSFSSINHLAEGDLREAAQIIELISRSTAHFPDMTALFYDELSAVVSAAPCINKNFLAWLTDAVTNDLQQNFIVDRVEKTRISGLKLTMQHCLNAEGEMDEVIAINIAGLTLQTKEVNIAILSPLFQLVQTLHSKQHEGDLTSIDALLGCPIVMPEFDLDVIEDMDTNAVNGILDCLIHCINWFRELLNAFALQNDESLRLKILSRAHQVQEMETLISNVLLKSNISYKPPVCTFNIGIYTGNQIEKIIAKPQAPKQKANKKQVPNDTILPETAKTQVTQNNNNPIKHRLEAIQRLPLRELSINLLNLLNSELTSDNDITNLNIKSLKYLLNSLNGNLEKVLISKVKRMTFLTKPEDNVAYDAKKAELYAKLVNEVLPKVLTHLETVTSYIEDHTKDDSQNDTGTLYPADFGDYLTCLEYLYNFLTTYFKWIGFRNHHIALLKVSLRTIASKENSQLVSLKDLLLAVAKYMQKHEKNCLQLSTAVSLIELLKTIQEYSHSGIVLKIVRDMAHSFLARQWKTIDGANEKGLLFNQSVERLFQIYFINNEIISLKNLALQLTNDIENLKGKNDSLESFKCINKSNFPILYRNLGTAVHDAAKTRLSQKLTNSEHLEVWKDVATALKYMSDVAKTLDTRNNLSAFFKKSLPILKLFISQGVPILELNLKTRTQEVLEVLKILQQSTRFLQSLCCHARLKNDMALMSKVPYMRQTLETLIYKVKAVLVANNCSEAFWMGNLKNKNIHGEVIATQASQSEESVDDCDEQLPNDESDVEDDDDINSVSDII